MAEIASYFIVEKNTFLHVQEGEEIRPRARSASWSCGDTWLEDSRIELLPIEKPSELKLKYKNNAEEVCDECLQPTKPAKQMAEETASKCHACVFYASRFGCSLATCPFVHDLIDAKPQKRARPQKHTRKTSKCAVDELFQHMQDPAPAPGI
ncbi:unnamed protein product [Durusdinium trenchii]|uniref:Uncharacterized protein n=2 Tax=Durusdinium trenchii TaxID=1381693 RepID=A0ABP0HL07_9DINO